MNVAALASRACIAVLPVQDMMILGSEARMNIPSTPAGNWQFRLKKMPARRDWAILRKMIEGLNR